MGLDLATRDFLQSLRDAVIEAQGSLAPPEAVENLRVTPIAGGNLVEFTRTNAVSYVLFWNTVPNFNTASPIPIQLDARYEHIIGAGSVKIHYWIRARQPSGQEVIVGPESGITLALGTPVTPPTPPAPGTIPYPRDAGDGSETGVGAVGVPRTV